jgi:hypothetical protein
MLHGVGQLAHVSRPRVPEEQLLGRGAEAGSWTLLRREQHAGERQHIFAPFAQGRHDRTSSGDCGPKLRDLRTAFADLIDMLEPNLELEEEFLFSDSATRSP